ncbi:hypothetical protein GGI00_003217 [Coemansia sp. RSA 2681]|nr:hypothetical protein GGI00_003217 [Coemansia sp. RSA 2681]
MDLSAPNSDASDTAAGPMAASAIANGAAKGLKPYRCAMSDCNHAYKNVSGLEYHIFQSRKSNNHLMLGSPGNKSAADGLDGGSDDTMPDVVMAESNASAELLDSLIHGSAATPGNHADDGGLALTSPTQSGVVPVSPALQCVEVDCLTRFSSEYALRQHVATQHPRPIRRAIKPSNRAKPGRNAPTEQPSPNASFWNTTTINDVLGAAAMESTAIGGVGQAAMGLGSMPTIPESGISTPVSQTMEAAVAMAAAMGYGADQHGLALTSNSSGVGQPLMGRGRQAAHRRLMLQGISNQPLLQATAGPFLSAPALINANGGEPNIGSYFALGLSHASDAHQHHHPMTPTLFGVSSVGNAPMPPDSMDAAAASMMLEAMSQAAAASATGNEGQLSLNATRQDSAAHEGDSVSDAALASNYLQDMSGGGGGMDNMSLNMQLMHSMMGGDSFYMPPHDNDGGNQAANVGGNGEGDVNMEDIQQKYSRSQRSDSFDLSSVATVPNSGSSSSTIQPPAMAPGDAVEPSATMSAGSKSGAHSQIATALMSKRNWQQQQQQLQQQVPAASNTNHTPTSAGQQQPGLLPWTHGFSALGLLPFPSDSHNRQAMSDGFPQPQHQHRFYTPQPTDLAQFQTQQQPLQSMHSDMQQPASAAAPNSAGPRYQRQFVSTLQLGQLQHLPLQHPPPLYSSNSIIPCPALGCRQAFTDANALKHHLSYDHPRDAPTMMSANASNPGSPMEGFLSTMPTNHQAPMFSLANAPMSAGAILQPRHQPQGMLHLDPALAPGTAASDRSKAPHWIDTNTWSTWIAAANGQGDVTAAAAATAMGITPGINGPQAFIPAVSTPLNLPTYSHTQQQQQHPATSELLQMFQSVNRADTS